MGDGKSDHPDIDTKLRDPVFPDLVFKVNLGQLTGESEIPSDWLSNPSPIEGTCQGIGDRVGYRPVEPMSDIKRCHKSKISEQRIRQVLNPSWGDAFEVSINDNDRFGFEVHRFLEEVSEVIAFSFHALRCGDIDLGYLCFDAQKGFPGTVARVIIAVNNHRRPIRIELGQPLTGFLRWKMNQLSLVV